MRQNRDVGGWLCNEVRGGPNAVMTVMGLMGMCDENVRKRARRGYFFLGGGDLLLR